ncbi:hypothetical protein LMG28690_02101 [Paraburkholderia caffeinilytica]|nr:hypothetical protein LMG28690_02101 [Paraburkholderia caffeinilytica]
MPFMAARLHNESVAKGANAIIGMGRCSRKAALSFRLLSSGATQECSH